MDKSKLTWTCEECGDIIADWEKYQIVELEDGVRMYCEECKEEK